jgi:hypothetical protein
VSTGDDGVSRGGGGGEFGKKSKNENMSEPVKNGEKGIAGFQIPPIFIG